MKFISKSFEKFMSCAESGVRGGEGKGFKRSTDYCEGNDGRVYSGHGHSKSKYTQPGSNFVSQVGDSQAKSKSLLKQARCIKSAIPERKGIIKNF